MEGLDEAEKTSGVDEILITARLRDYVAAWPEGSSYLGFIFARAEKRRRKQNQFCELRMRSCDFIFSPRLPVEHPVTGRLSHEPEFGSIEE